MDGYWQAVKKVAAEFGLGVSILVFVAVLVLLFASCLPKHPTPAGQLPPTATGGSTVTATDAQGNTTTIVPPTPAAQALAAWVKWGAVMSAIGIAMCLPIFGGNVRTGSVVAFGGVLMAGTGKALGDVTLTVPAWFLPALLLLVAGGMLWGWHVREKQGGDHAGE